MNIDAPLHGLKLFDQVQNQNIEWRKSCFPGSKEVRSFKTSITKQQYQGRFGCEEDYCEDIW